MKKSKCFATLAAVFALEVTAAHSQNLIQNPDFDNGLTGWTQLSGPPTTIQVNSADGSPSAPSVQIVTSVIGSTYGVGWIDQCVSLIGVPPPWSFAVRGRVVSSTGNCQIVISAIPAGGTCASPGVGVNNYATAGGTVSGAQGTFTEYVGMVDSDPMTGGVASQIMTLFAAVSCTNPGDSMTLNVDHAYLATDVIFASSFDS